MNESAENPYRAPEGNPESLARSNPTEDELRAFFGEDAEYYLACWRMQAERGWWAVGFNWAAAFFFLLWCLYRKLYLVFVLVSFVSSVVGFSIPVKAFWVVVLGSWISCGVLGNHLYLHRARSVIARISESDPDERIRLIRKAGGTSRVAMALGIIVLFWPIVPMFTAYLPYFALIAGIVYWLSRRPGAAAALNLHDSEVE